MSRPLSPELSLVVACCRWPLGHDALDAIDRAISRGIDWTLFERIVLRNRIAPLVSNALTKASADLPGALARRLALRVQECARRSLVMARESLRLQRAFDDASVPLMIVKGTPLAILAYGELGMKESWDIDLLVAPDDAARAIGLLVDLEYNGVLAGVEPSRLQAYVTYGKEAEFTHVAQGITAELHWRLTDNPRLLRSVGVTGRGQEVPMPGGRIRTLADEELFTYLCVHGTYHNWSRLKWLADVGAILGDRTPAEIADLQSVAQSYGAGRCATVALLLCRQLFGLSLDEGTVRALEGDRVAGLLVSNAIAGLAYRHGAFEMRPYTWPWLRMMAGHFFAASGRAHRAEQFRVLWNSPEYRSSVPPTRSLELGYHLVRLPRWLWRVSSRMVQRTRA